MKVHAVKMKPQHTVNVILQIGTDIQKMVSFPDTNVGNIVAEAVFTSWITDEIGKKPDPDILECFLETGAWIGKGSQVLMGYSFGNEEGDRCDTCGALMTRTKISIRGIDEMIPVLCSNRDCDTNNI